MLGPRSVEIISSHVDVVCKQYGITDEFKTEEICKLVKMFSYAATSQCYDAAWAYFAAAFASCFEPEDSYVFLCFVVKKLFPKNYFSAKGLHQEKNAQTCLFSMFVGDCSPKLLERLTTTKIVLDCVNCAEDTITSKEAFYVYCRKLSDAYLTKTFACQISCAMLLKYLDFLFLEGYDFCQKTAVYAVNFLYWRSIHTIKKVTNGVEKSEDNLSVAAIVSTESLLKPIKDKKFLSLIRGAREDAKISELFSEHSDSYYEDAKKMSHKSKTSVKDSRLGRIVKLKQDFEEYNVELNHDAVYDYIVAFEKYANNYKKFPGRVVPYENYKKYLTKNNKWHINLINSLFVTIDSRLKGCVTAAEFASILILVSNITKEDKMYMICSQLQPDNDGKINVNGGICLIDKLEDVIAYDLKGCKLNSGSIVSKVEQKYQNVEMVALAEFVDFSRQLAETKPIFEVFDVNYLEVM